MATVVGGIAAQHGTQRVKAAVAKREPTTAESDQLSLRELAAWLFAYTRPYAAKRNALLSLVLVRAVQLPLVIWVLGRVIGGPIASGSWSGTLWGVLIFLLLSASVHLVYHFRQRYALELGEAVVHDVRNDIFAHLQRMQVSFFNDTRLGQILSRLTSDTDAIRAGVQDVVFNSLVAGGQMVVAAALMAYADRVLFVVVAGVAPLLWLVNRYFRGRLREAHTDVQQSLSLMTSTLSEAVQGVRVTQAFVRQQQNSQAFRGLISDHSHRSVAAARTVGLFLPLMELQNRLFLAILLLLGGYRVLHPEIQMPVADLIQFLLLANIFFQPMQTLADQYNQAMVTLVSAQRVRELLDTPPQWSDPDVTLSPCLAGKVEFEGVSFAYERGRLVLQDLNFTAEPGQTIALVGHTGSGKSSVINLVAKFYLPTSGRLAIDGHDIRDLDTAAYRRQIGIVSQLNFLFSGTILENIRWGAPEASDEGVREVVHTLGFLDMVEGLPDGFATEVGEGGGNLSLGQRQLICFARCLLADPRILIMDEATSSIDVFTEQRIQQAMKRLMRGRTSFIVAHRLSTIRDADQVLVLQQGRIVERGTHASLLAHGGVYAALHQPAQQQAA